MRFLAATGAARFCVAASVLTPVDRIANAARHRVAQRIDGLIHAALDGAFVLRTIHAVVAIEVFRALPTRVNLHCARINGVGIGIHRRVYCWHVIIRNVVTRIDRSVVIGAVIVVVGTVVARLVVVRRSVIGIVVANVVVPLIVIVV
jgi:hypothetical protein